MVKAQALPGRRFSKSADRKGWLYINTWYMIGPWESFGREDFSIVHPPEISVDFDAVYTDGQVGTGVMETDSHPIKVIGEEVYLDGTLRWKFMQSESMHNTVPVTTGHSTYYAYTELYFDEATTMLVAIGTDDSGRVWIMVRMYGAIMVPVGIILTNILLLSSSVKGGTVFLCDWKMAEEERVVSVS